MSIYTKVPAVNSAVPSPNAPVKTDVPVKTDAPVKTEAPVKTDEPTQTEAPAKTQAPKETEAPVKTQAPKETQAPTRPPEMLDHFSAPYRLEFNNATVKTQGNASFTLDGNKVNIEVSGQYAGVAFVVPDSVEENNFDTVTITYEKSANVGDGFGCGLWRSGDAKDSETVTGWNGIFKDSTEGTYTTSINTSTDTKTWYVNKCLLFNNTDKSKLQATPAKVTIVSVVFSNSQYNGEATATSKPTVAPTKAPTPTKAPGGVAASDFTDKSIVTAEGDDVVINVSGDSVCNITLPAFKALIVKNPDTSKNCKYMQIECTSDLVDVYLFDNRFTDGTGQTAAGQHSMGQMSSPTYKTFLFEINGEFSGNYITAAKFVNIDWGGNSKSMKIKSIKFLKDKPQTEAANIADMATIMNPPSDYDKKKDNVEYGSFTNISYYSDITKSNRTANVVLPPNYDTSKKYPVVYMMHGIGCAKEMFGTSIDNSSIAKIYGNLRAEGKAVDMIIVFPGIRVSDEPEKDTHSNENYKHYDDFREDLINNLMPAMSKKFSVKTGRENTAICGWSMGGREALYIGLSKPEYFGYVAGYCPAFGLLPYTNADVGKSEDGLLTIPGATEDILKISDEYVNNTFIQIGHGIYDSVVHNEPTRYSKALTNGGVPHIYTEYPSGHSDGVYNPGFYNLALNAFKLVK